MMTHPSDPQLAAIISGELDDPGIEAHIDACDRCSAALAALAREELALLELAEAAAAAPPLAARHPRRWPLAAAAVAAAAAAVLLTWQPPSPAVTAPPDGITVMVSRCALQPDASCSHEAAQQGLMLGDTVPDYASYAPGMPRYDAPGSR